MGTSALLAAVGHILNGYDPVAAIVEGERERGFKIIRPGSAAWFRTDDWRPASVASIDGRRCRLVLLHAVESGRGAMTRTIAGIKDVGLVPVIVEPTRELAVALRKRDWRPRNEGSTFETFETIWMQR